ncbi:MAG: YIP1 family protein [Acidobacteria bacterium]|nr:YIP1 family protein [Acidobacteriota bacterium]MBI3263449.1 YIP1 family protein [Acidobacteriota bacterium]
MSTTTEDSGRTTARMGLISRLVGTLTSPGATFARVAGDPRPLGMLLLVMLVSAVFIGGFFSTEVGRQAFMDEQARRMEAFGRQMSPQQQRGMEMMLPYMAYLGAGQALVFIPVVTLVVSGLLLAVFNPFLGGRATFKQLFTVVVHSGAVIIVQQLFVWPLNYVRESMSSATNLAVFLPMLEENSFLTRLLGTIDLFIVWWTIVLAIGLSVLYRRKLTPILISFFIVYGAIAVGVAAFMRGGGS